MHDYDSRRITQEISSIQNILSKCYDTYLRKHGLDVDQHFWLTKLIEEVGELARQDLAINNSHPKEYASEEKLSEEACDVLCQILLYIDRHGLDITKALKEKWLLED